MAALNPALGEELVPDIADDVKSHSAAAAANKLEHFGGAAIARSLSRLAPGFAQDILATLPAEARERAFAEASAELARQWQRNAAYPKDSIGRMMEPVVAGYPPEQTVGETIDKLRELVKTTFITYVYVLERDEQLLGLVTMRDLLFSDNSATLRNVMFRDPFALQAAMPLMDAMKLVLDRHYPVYPVVDAEKRLVGLLRGQTMFEAQAIEISLQAGSMVGLEKEERVATHWWRSLKLRHPWLQFNLLTAFVAAAVVGLFQGTLDRLVILALFLPVLAGQSGNTGCQALAVTLRGMTLGELKRGVAVAYTDPVGPLERNGETFYAISPTPSNWTPTRSESFFREYNDYMLEDVTVHEAMPGHYLQLAHSNQFKAPTKVRAIFRSGAFAEGWAVYAEQLMAEHGFGGPEVHMQQLKMRLRTIINAIIDQKIHTAGMTESQAMNFMMNEGFQEEGEAAGKWRRAELTSTQLSNYFVGVTEVNDIRRAYEAKAGGHVDYKRMHDAMLSYGTPAPKYVREMMGL